MLLNRIFFLLVYFGCPLVLVAQEDSIVLVPAYTLQTPTRLMTADKMGFLYLVSDQHTLQKFNLEGNPVFRFNENSLGAITHVDASNPFQVLAYYEEYLTAIVLDRTLSEAHRFNLQHLSDITQIQALALATDNNLWLYNPNTFLLEKIDQHGQAMRRSPDLSMLMNKGAFQPNFLLEYESRIFVNDPEYGILMFDQFGNYIQTIPIQGLTYFSAWNNQLFYLDKTPALRAYHLKMQDDYRIPLPFSLDQVQQIVLQNDRLWLRFADKIECFQIEKIKKQ